MLASQLTQPKLDVGNKSWKGGGGRGDYDHLQPQVPVSLLKYGATLFDPMSNVVKWGLCLVDCGMCKLVFMSFVHHK